MSGVSPRQVVEDYVRSLPIGAEFTVRDICTEASHYRGAYPVPNAIPHYLRTMTDRDVQLINKRARIWKVIA